MLCRGECLEDNDKSCGLVRITGRLDSALRYLRDKTLPRLLWIDAICINHDDVEDRGPHVAWMGEVYQQATRVVVFLGRPMNASTLALELLDDPGRKVDVDWRNSITPSTGMKLSSIGRIYQSKSVLETLKCHLSATLLWPLDTMRFTPGASLGVHPVPPL